MRIVLVVLAAALLGCSPMAGSACKTACDCVGAPAPVRCPGTFSCTNNVCTYACSASCGASDAGCPDGGTCKDNLCVSPTPSCGG